MPRRRGNTPEHARGGCRAQEATVRSLVADALKGTHEAHAAAQHDPAGSARTFLGEAALLAVRALNGLGAPTLLPVMHRIVNAVQPGLIGPEASLHGYWMEWCTFNRPGRPLSMGDNLLHALRARCPRDAAPYLSQARATYPGGVSRLDAALNLLQADPPVRRRV